MRILSRSRGAVYQREWRKNHPKNCAEFRKRDRVRAKRRYRVRPLWARNRLLKQFHKITWDEFLIRVESQNGRCAICGIVLEVESKKCTPNKACMDHDHATGKNRGVLCHLCNRAIGMFHESVEALVAAADYIKKWRQP